MREEIKKVKFSNEKEGYGQFVAGLSMLRKKRPETSKENVAPPKRVEPMSAIKKESSIPRLESANKPLVSFADDKPVQLSTKKKNLADIFPTSAKKSASKQRDPPSASKFSSRPESIIDSSPLDYNKKLTEKIEKKAAIRSELF